MIEITSSTRLELSSALVDLSPALTVPPTNLLRSRNSRTPRDHNMSDLRTRFIRTLVLIALSSANVSTYAQQALPEGNSGIAVNYPGDVGIGAAPSVIFVEDFEGYSSASQLTQKWSNYYQAANTRIVTGSGVNGSKAAELTLPTTGSEVSNALVRNLSSRHDTLFVRAYTKFSPGFHQADAGGHNGIRISGNYPGPGIKPNGRDFFLTLLENTVYKDEPRPGYTEVYIYHPEQREQWGDHWYPDGKVIPFDAIPGDFGPNFVSRPNFVPLTDRWYSYELMVRLNLPGQRDGRIAVWIDGVLVADFHNVRFRDVDTLKIDQIQLELHTQSNPSGVDKKWYDNVVVATSYIGPMFSGPPNPQVCP